MTKYSDSLIFKLLVSLCLCYIASCGQTDSNSIRFGLSAAPVTLDPRYATDAASQRINRLIYRRLVDFDDNYQLRPQLAEWEKLSEKHYRFHLLDSGREFHNGQRLDAGDIKATYEYILDSENASPHRATLINIDEIQVIDSDNFEIFINEADSLFPGRLVIGILPSSLITAKHPFNEQPIGSGPMRFAEYRGEDHILLERISDNQLFEFITVKDATVRALKLVRGELDLIQGDLPYELLGWLRKQDELRIESHIGSVFTYIGFNFLDPVLSELDIRKAVAYAVDREAIIKYVLGNAARKAGGLLPPEHWAGHPHLSGYPYDPDKARKLLSHRGFNRDRPLQLTYKTSNNALRLRLATIIQYQLQQVGIDVDLNSYDWGTFYADIKSGRFDMYSLSWVGLNMPDIFRYVFHSKSLPPIGANRGRYSDSITDDLIELAEQFEDPYDKIEIYHRLQQRLHEQLPYIPLWYEDNLLARRENITGYKLSASGDYDGLIHVNRTH